jgi:hypothetical protein
MKCGILGYSSHPPNTTMLPEGIQKQGSKRNGVAPGSRDPIDKSVPEAHQILSLFGDMSQ